MNSKKMLALVPWGTAHGQFGFSILASLVGISITAILLNVAVNAFSAKLALASKISQKADLEDIREYLRIGIDCPQTMAAIPPLTHSGMLIALHDRNPATPALVRIPTTTIEPTRIGRIKIRANCAVSNCKQIATEFFSNASNQWKPLQSVPKVCK